MMDTVDKIVIHGVSQLGELTGVPAVFGGLNVGIAYGIGDFRRESAFYGCSGYKRCKDDNAGLYLPQRILSLYRNTGTEAYAVLEDVVIVNVPVTYHLQHGSLGEIDFVSVPIFPRSGGNLLCFRFCAGQRIQSELLSGEDVVHHDNITGENSVGHHRKRRQQLNQISCPGSVFPAVGVRAKRYPKLPFGWRCIEDRADDKNQIPVAFRFIA